jgi:hypothetical protein
VTVSAEHRLLLDDGSTTVAFGFPVPWHRAGADNVRVVHSGAAIFDLIFYGLPVFLVLLRTHRFWFRHRRVAALASVVAMTVAAVGFRRAAGPNPTFAPATPPSASSIVERSTTLRWGLTP